MIFPEICPLYAGENLRTGTLMYTHAYTQTSCVPVCDIAKTTGEFCVPGVGCTEGSILDPAHDGQMFFHYGDVLHCEAALQQGLCGGPT
jgi:hypothetical protein